LTEVHSYNSELDARYLLAGSNVFAQLRAAWKIAAEVGLPDGKLRLDDLHVKVTDAARVSVGTGEDGLD